MNLDRNLTSGTRLASQSTRAPGLEGLNCPDWMLEGVCAQIDPEKWYPEPGKSPRIAKEMCATCPVIDQCLTFALDHDERFGVWGGMTPTERQKLAVPRVCDLDGCDVEFHAQRGGPIKYCCVEHNKTARLQRIARRRKAA